MMGMGGATALSICRGKGEEKEGREDICWFLQRDRWERMKEKGMPDYLQFPQDHILLLKEDC